MTILVATDFSAAAALVTDAAAAFARARGELLVLVHLTGGPVSAGPSARMLSEATRLDEVCRVRPIVEEGRPNGERFAVLAKETRAGLLVVGAQGVTLRAPLGTVATSIIEHVRDVPVLVGRAPERLHRKPARALASLALDETDRGVFAALQLVKSVGIVDVDVAHYRALPAEHPQRHQAEQLVERDVRERLADLPPGMTLHQVLPRDATRPIDDDIGALVRLRDTDLVVCGSHHRRGVERFLRGSVSERIVLHAPVSVLVAAG